MRLKKKVEIEDGFVKQERDLLPSFYLAPSKMQVEELDECEVVDELDGKLEEAQRCILRNLVAVPIRSSRDDIEASLLAALAASQDKPLGSNVYTFSGAAITDRDRGVYDSLTPLFGKWLGKPQARKQIFEKMRLRGNSPSPYHSFLSAIESTCNLKVTGLLIEVADSPNAASLSLGAAVLVTKADAASDWILTVANYKTIVKEQAKSTADAKLVECYMDELLGLHFALGIPVVISDSLFKRICVDGLLEKRESDSYMKVSAPFFDNESGSAAWNKALDETRARPAKMVPKVSEISSASTFLSMRLSEKRACLRASGVVSLPRPREGARKVDAIMIPLLDEEVAYEVLRRLGETKGDFDRAAKMNDYETIKPQIAKQYSEAMKKGDIESARKFVDELNAIATLAFDPSNPDEEVKKGSFDIEEWYWQERKRVYGIVAA